MHNNKKADFKWDATMQVIVLVICLFVLLFIISTQWTTIKGLFSRFG